MAPLLIRHWPPRGAGSCFQLVTNPAAKQEFLVQPCTRSQWVFADYASQDLPHQDCRDAKLASLSILRKWPVFMATTVKTKIKKVKYLSTYSSYFHNISSWTSVLEHDRANGVGTLRFQSQLIAKINIQRKQHIYNLIINF